MEAITIPHVRIPSINIGGICLPGIGAPGSIGKKGLIWTSGMKEAIKAIYDPKKQGMTNYDVIEAYTEDFKKWNNFPEKYTGSLTSNSLALTNVSQKTALIYSPIKPYDFKVLIRGLQEGQHVKFGFDYGETILEADKDGVYTLEWKEGLISYGIYTNFVGECNITITQLPTSILKDLSGNGNHAYLYGGKGKLNSGMGVYQQDFSNIRGATAVSSDGFEVTKKSATYLARISIGYWNNKECKLLFETNNTTQRYFIRWRKADNVIVTAVELHKGENIIPVQEDISEVAEVIFEGLLEEGEYIKVTQIPDYPDQLCYDGKMYAVCYGFPILTDYTVMAERTWFDNEGNRVFITKGNIWPNCAFNFEKVNVSLSSETFSYSQSTNIDDLIGKSGITYQTKQSYNGKVIGVGTSSDGDILLIGGQLKGEYVGCHGKIIIADRSFTEDEITWLKENIYNIEI